MKFYLAKTPNIIQQFFSEYVWRFTEEKKEIYLTFDDGPTQDITPFVLEQLNKYEAKATFFCIGKNIINHPEIFDQLLLNGHAVGNHTQNHLNGFKTKVSAYIENLLTCEETLNSRLKTLNSKLFRPPYGKIKKKQAVAIRKLGYRIILWDVLSADFDTRISKEKCLENILENTGNGSIIVFHDSLKASEKLKYALPKVLEFYSKKGFKFKAIT